MSELLKKLEDIQFEKEKYLVICRDYIGGREE